MFLTPKLFVTIALLYSVSATSLLAQDKQFEVKTFKVRLETYQGAYPWYDFPNGDSDEDSNGSSTSGAMAIADASRTTDTAHAYALSASMHTHNIKVHGNGSPGHPRRPAIPVDNPRISVSNWNRSEVAGPRGYATAASTGTSGGKLKVKQAGTYVADVVLEVTVLGDDVLLSSMQAVSVTFGENRIEATYEGNRWRWQKYYGGNPDGPKHDEPVGQSFKVTETLSAEEDNDGSPIASDVDEELAINAKVDIFSLSDERIRFADVFGTASVKVRKE